MKSLNFLTFLSTVFVLSFGTCHGKVGTFRMDIAPFTCNGMAWRANSLGDTIQIYYDRPRPIIFPNELQEEHAPKAIITISYGLNDRGQDCVRVIGKNISINYYVWDDIATTGRSMIYERIKANRLSSFLPSPKRHFAFIVCQASHGSKRVLEKLGEGVRMMDKRKFAELAGDLPCGAINFYDPSLGIPQLLTESTESSLQLTMEEFNNLSMGDEQDSKRRRGSIGRRSMSRGKPFRMDNDEDVPAISFADLLGSSSNNAEKQQHQPREMKVEDTNDDPDAYGISFVFSSTELESNSIAETFDQSMPPLIASSVVSDEENEVFGGAMEQMNPLQGVLSKSPSSLCIKVLHPKERMGIFGKIIMPSLIVFLGEDSLAVVGEEFTWLMVSETGEIKGYVSNHSHNNPIAVKPGYQGIIASGLVEDLNADSKAPLPNEWLPVRRVEMPTKLGLYSIMLEFLNLSPGKVDKIPEGTIIFRIIECGDT